MNLDKKKIVKWRGIKGKIFAWHIENPLLNLLERLLLGDGRSSFFGEFSRIVQGDEVILDVGAGTGRFSLEMAKRVNRGRVICLDLSEVMLHFLKKKAEKKGLKDRIQALNAEASSTGLEDESVDLVISNNVLHELPNPEATLTEMVRVLKPGGWAIISDFRDTRIAKMICKVHSKDAHGPFSIDELNSLFFKAGLRDVRVKIIRHWVIGISKK